MIVVFFCVNTLMKSEQTDVIFTTMNSNKLWYEKSGA